MKRKFLSILLVAVICISLAPATALAADTETTQDIAEIANNDSPLTENKNSAAIASPPPAPPAETPEVTTEEPAETLPPVDLDVAEESAAEVAAEVDSATAIPEPVASLQAVPEKFDTIFLSWKKAAKATKYAIYRSTVKDGEYAKLKTVGDVSTYKDATVSVGVTYYYKVLSFNQSIRGAYSNVVQSKTALEKPENIKASRLSHNSIELSWSAVEGATKYIVYRGYEATGEYEKMATVSQANKHIDVDLDTGLTYYYKVLPFMNDTRGLYSDTVSIKTTLDKLSGLKATARDDGTIMVSWNKTPGADRYKVYRSTTADGGAKLITTLNNLNAYIDRTAEEGTTYYYKVAPQCGMMNGGAVGPVSATAVNKDTLKSILSVGRSLIGTRYVLGGKSPSGFDCSGYVWYVLNNAGYGISYMTSSQWRGANFPTYYSMSDAQPGDILCFNGHVGIYAGNGIMLDSGSGGVRETSLSLAYWQRNFICVKRIL